nr:hypothetical protein [Tanacetum cinerariifolium]
GEGSAIPTEPHHTPYPQKQHSPHHDPSSPSHPTATTEPIPQTSTEPPTKTSTLRRYTRRATWIAQSKALSPVADEPTSLLRDELMDLCTNLQRQQTQMAAKIKDQDLKISGLKARVKLLEDKDRGTATTTGVPTVSGLFPTASVIFTTASMVTPYLRRSRGISTKDKGKEKVVESERMSEKLARGSEIARLHAEEELKMMIEGLDRSNEVIAKHLQEYEQSKAELTVGEKIELINELEQREFYMSVLRSHAGWKTKHFRGMTLEEIKEKFIPVWKQLEDFVPMSSKEEGEREKRKGLKLDQGSAKRIKTSEDVSERDLKGMMQLVPLEEVYVEALQIKHPIIDWKIHSEGHREEDLHQLWTLVNENLSIRQATKDKEKELWVELKRLFEPDFEYQLWTHNQAFMHDPLEWKLYDTCGVHHVFSKDQEIFMLVEKDYPLRKGLATVMICNKLQVEQYSQMANDLILKIYNIANSPR